MWQINLEKSKKSAFKKISKKFPNEYNACFRNLDKLFDILNNGNKIHGFKVGFFRSEGEDLFRISQTGVQHAKEIRLYVYLNEKSKIMYIIDIGTKETQSVDINNSKKIIRNIKKQESIL